MKKELPELPWIKRERYKKDFGIKDEDVETFVQNKLLANYFEEIVTFLDNNIEKIKLASNYITNDIVDHVKRREEVNEDFSLPQAKYFAELINMISDGKLSSRGAKDVLEHMYGHNGSPEKIADKLGLMQQSDEGELKKIIEKIIKDNSNVVEDYKKGKQASLQFLIGQVMKKSKGSANPQIVQKILKQILE